MIHETFDEFWQREGIRFLHEGKAPTHEQQARHAWESRQEEIEDEKTESFTLQRAIDEFCLHHAFSTEQWKSHPTAKVLFELRSKR